MRKPLIVYVSGAPGSGKTTLADKIAKELYIPHITNDLLHGGVRLTLGQLNDLAKRGISFVYDSVMVDGVSQADIIAKLVSDASIINIHTQASNPLERYAQREHDRNDKQALYSGVHDQKIVSDHETRLPKTVPVLDLGEIPQIVVNTDSDYMPSFEKIMEFIEKQYPLYIKEQE